VLRAQVAASWYRKQSQNGAEPAADRRMPDAGIVTSVPRMSWSPSG